MLYQRLSPQGVLVVFEHNPYNPVTRHIVNTCPYDEDAVLLKPSELRHLLESARMTVNGSGYCLFVPPRFSALAWMEGLLKWFPMGGQYWVQAVKLA